MNKFLTNYTPKTFLEQIKELLRECNSFDFSVSFIKKAGLVLLKEDIESALNRGCKGRIITSTYQNFTDIESLKYFLNLSDKYDNFEIHLDYGSFYNDKNFETLGYHSKGYIFDLSNNYVFVVGSSNITRYALLKNIEWDISIEENKESETSKMIKSEFESNWNRTEILTSELISKYAQQISYSIERWDMDYEIRNFDIKPNYMQRKALKELNRYRAIGVDKALVVASTGSGKTYLAAFDALNFEPKKLLYVVHESSILEKSLETFQKVFGTSVSYGKFGDGFKEFEADFLFSTNISMNNSLYLFDKKEFDYIIIDECHHAVAESYKNIIDYFEPQFLIGLTATPERMDNADVFGMFDGNVPFELRLKDAIANGLIVPFKYFGIRDELIDYGLNKEEERRLVSQSVMPDHIEFIVEQIKEHLPSGKLKALAFCKTKAHAKMMAEALSDYFKTSYLTGENSTGERIKAYNELQKDIGGIEILCTVDILNEGVDIPGVNTILFLRPTESSTIFIQQLGRGLRKFDGKEYVTVLDFVGNSYKRSVQVAFALGSLSDNFLLEKRLMMQMVEDDFNALDLIKYGVEIHFDKLSKEEIINQLEKENFNNVKYLKQDYLNFKKYLNIDSYPKHMDYLNNDFAPNLLRFMQTKMNGKKNISYYSFLKKIDEDVPLFNDDKVLNFINYLSEMLPLVRPYEYEIFSAMFKIKNNDFNTIEKIVEKNIKTFTKKEFDHAIKFIKEKQMDGAISLYSDDLVSYLNDLFEYGLTRYYIDHDDTKEFDLYKTYRIDQVQLKLCNNPGFTAKGTYFYDNVVYIFAGLKKDASIEEKINYKDIFLDSSTFQWESENNIEHKSPSANDLKNSKKAHIFVRKVVEEDGITQPFIYIGEAKLTNPRPESTRNSLIFDAILDNELPEYLCYDFEIKEKEVS